MSNRLFLLMGVLVFSAPAFAQAEAEKLQIIEVKRGDTLSKISKKYLEDPSQWPALL